ncbi:hypothetical protein [Leisingera aquimarina]|uniref:hypothetical protein n=1 Tax=Leisingera aquimarina TaxID=476529 RepID=UPI001B7F9E5A|nr:hypothetical protein [Leisingera aquimarina]
MIAQMSGRGDHHEKDRVLRHARAFLFDIREKRIAYILRQRQPNLATRLATQLQDTGVPVDIAQSETSDIPARTPGAPEGAGSPGPAGAPGKLIAGCNDTFPHLRLPDTAATTKDAIV